MRNFKRMFATIALSSCVLACGGGGGSDAVTDGSNSDSSDDSGQPIPSMTCGTITFTSDDVVRLVNQARQKARQCGTETYAAAGRVSWDSKLTKAALNHSQDMSRNNFFSHTGSNGSSLGNRVTNAGYTWSSVAENIAAGQRSLGSAIDGWIASPGHCVNMMSANVTQIGLGCSYDQGADYKYYWTLVLAKPQ